jgi:hypothetical protein
MYKFVFVIICLTWSFLIKAQDERYFRQIFSGEINRNKDIEKTKSYSYLVHTPYYALDINDDQTPEQIVFIKKDSEDWIEILDKKKEKIFSYQFETKGYDSELFRIELKKLNATTRILLLYYYEGISRYLDFNGTSRIYAITIDNSDLSTMAGFKGPSFFDEKKSLKGHYHKRHYEVILTDLNKDLTKELIVKYRNSHEVFVYRGKGKWQTFNQSQL